jgi:ABC-2 type transport system ATP-binding protein
MVQVHDLTFSYGKEKLFNGLNLELAPGNIYGLLGLNGAGKSTFLKLVCGLLYVDSGECLVDGKSAAKRDPLALSEIFMLPEELYLPGMSAKEYVYTMAPFYPRFDHERFKGYMEEFQLPEKKILTKYSYGMKKKFLLSFGLAANTRLFILDEPTNGLDIPAKGQFRRMVAEALSDDRIFIISTHQVRDVDSLIDPVIIIHKGELLYSRSLEEISGKILMTQTAVKPDESKPGYLYSEPCVGGWWSVTESHVGSESRMDLEVLFNMSITDPARTRRMFADGKGGKA